MRRGAVSQFPVLNDNYVYVIDAGDGVCAVVDPSEAAFLEQYAAPAGVRWLILNTHHHSDHVGGNLAIKSRYGARIIGPKNDAARIPGIDEGVGEGDLVKVGALTARVLEVPAHTRGHIAYYFEEIGALFCGDTLFSLGCGRLFEGTAEQMFAALAKFKLLPPETLVYCAHEYTESNYRFALTVDPENAALRKRGEEITALRHEIKPTVPSTIASELACNPFMRAATPEILGDLRARKDRS